MPLILTDSGWEDWAPPDGYPLRRRHVELATNWIGPLDTQQKELLEAVL